jgi:hypothetical protein
MKWLIKVITDQSLYNEDEVLYISKSKKLIKSLRELDLDVLYDPILNANGASKLETISKAQSERLAKAKNVMIAYIMQEEKACDLKMRDMVLESAGDFKLNARDLVIYPFLGNIRPETKEIARETFSMITDILPENTDEDIRML